MAKAYDGRCETCRDCNGQFQPVCGLDEKTYFNSCYADCHGTYAAKAGMCEANDGSISCDECDERIEKVCGTDG